MTKPNETLRLHVTKSGKVIIKRPIEMSVSRLQVDEPVMAAPYHPAQPGEFISLDPSCQQVIHPWITFPHYQSAEKTVLSY